MSKGKDITLTLTYEETKALASQLGVQSETAPRLYQASFHSAREKIGEALKAATVRLWEVTLVERCSLVLLVDADSAPEAIVKAHVSPESYAEGPGSGERLSLEIADSTAVEVDRG